MPSLSSGTRTVVIILALAILASPLSGCGVKPKKVDPPSGQAATQFPHTYPAPDDQH